MSDTAKWYVLHTYSGYEVMVKESLLQLAKNNNLEDTIHDIVIPMEQAVEEKNGKKKVVMRKVLPCYVFIKLIYTNSLWYMITNTRGVTGFVGPQGRPLPLTEEEVKRMKLEKKVVADLTLAIGDSVKIINGPLENFIGKIIEINATTSKAKVKVEIFGRENEVDVAFIDCEKV